MRSTKPIIHDLSQLELPDGQLPLPVRKSKLKTFSIGVAFSLLVHLLLVSTSYLLETDAKREVSTIAAKKPMRTRLVPREPLKKENLESKQVVNIAEPKEKMRPKEAKLAAEYDSSVDEETKSRDSSLTAKNISEKLQKSQASNQQEQRPQNQSQNQNQAQNPRQAQDALASKDGLLAKKETAQMSLRSKLIPTWKDQGMQDAAPFSDHLKNIEEDSATRLNTWEWVHASFFARIKEAVGRRWDPNRAIKRNDPSGRMVGKNDRMTQIVAKINKYGELLSIKVTRESGVYFLDDAALDAFKGAAPFSNPPKELFASNDTFEFPFGFMLTYNKGFKFDLDWKPY